MVAMAPGLHIFPDQFDQITIWSRVIHGLIFIEIVLIKSK